MTTPPQGPWGSGSQGGRDGQPGHGQPGQGGWSQPGQEHEQRGQHGGQPGQGGWGGQPQQHAQGGQGGWAQPGQGGHGGQGGWVQPGQQSRQGEHGQNGWGQTGQQGGYAQQPWAQQHWQQGAGQSPWQPGGGGGGGNKYKLPLLIGGAAVGAILLAVLVFLGVKALTGGDDTADPGPTDSTSQPTDGPTQGQSSGSTPAPSQTVANASGQAKAATDKLVAAGYECSDLFSGPQGSHRGCFKEGDDVEDEAVFQYAPDGTITAVSFETYDGNNVNNGQRAFDDLLQAIGGQAFSGDVGKVQAAVKGGQRESKVSAAWGELDLSNDGDRLRLSGKKTGADELDVPRKQFDTPVNAIPAALKAKGYDCSSSICRKKVGDYGSQSIYGIGDTTGTRILNISVYGDSDKVKSAFDAAIADAFGAVKGSDNATLLAWIKSHSDGKSHTAYVNGWRVELQGVPSGSSSGRAEVAIKYETFYV